MATEPRQALEREDPRPERDEVYPQPDLSIVTTLYNEEGNVATLHRQILAACEGMKVSYEIIFVEDGSTDGTKKVCEGLSPITLIAFRKNFGKTAALDAGVKHARGAIIVTLDGDLQDDPADIPNLVAKLHEGYDVVSGWRWQRKDNFAKRIVSRSANVLRKFFFSDSIHDSGCGLKAYRRECFRGVDLFGEMHRFIPAILEHRGFTIGEVRVNNRPRRWGVSKYDNLQRGMKSFADMVVVWFWDRFSVRPVHLFGVSGLALGVIGTVLLVWMAVEKLAFGTELSDKIWPLMGIFFIVAGIQFFTFGLLADILIKSYYKSHRRMNYVIKEVISRD